MTSRPADSKTSMSMSVSVSFEEKRASVLALALTLALFSAPQLGLEPDRALRKCPVGIFSEGDRLQGRLQVLHKQNEPAKCRLTAPQLGLEPRTP